MISKSSLIKLNPRKTDRRITVLSNGENLELSTNFPEVIYSVVDNIGTIVRSIHRWLNHLSQGLGLSVSLSTIEQYGRIMTYLCRWIEDHPPYPELNLEENIKHLSRRDVISWIHHMRENGAESHSTLHSREACLKEFINWLTTNEGNNVRSPEDSPWGRQGDLRYVVGSPTARSPKFISADLIIAILNEMHNECERCMFHTQYDTGLRISELVDFRLEDLPDENQYDQAAEFIPLYIRGSKGRGGQPKERITLISRAVIKRIKRYHNTIQYKMAPDWDINDPIKPVFLTANQLPWSTRNASKQFKQAVRRSSVSESFKTHWMRHGTAFSVLRSNIGKSYEDRMLTLQKMLGHSHLKTTEIYTQISPALLTKLTKSGNELDRLMEAEDIRLQTFLGQLQHKENRGHRG